MDTVKSSNPSKGAELSNVMAPEETALSDKSDRQREEDKEADTDTPDRYVAVPSASQRRAQEKHRYNTIGYQKKKQRAAVDFSTVSKGTNVKTRGALKQVLFNQGASDKIMVEERSGGLQGQVDALKQVLDSFSLPADLRWTWGEGGNERALENSWTDIVHSHESMSKLQRHQQEALWELLNTELTYINKLTIVKELVLAALSHCHGHGFLQEVSPTLLFSNLPYILDAHRLFWHEVMYPMLQEVRLTGRPFDPLKLEAGCLQFSDRFPAYFEYCCEEDRNVEFTSKQAETNPQFHTYLTWVENHPQCWRMRLGDMQAKPHQRITKYPLLLKVIQRTTEDIPTKNSLDRMLNSVNNFLESINNYLQQKEDGLALSAAAQKIEGYKIEGLSEEIDKQVRAFCHFDLTSPMRGVGPNIIRKLLMEDALKVRTRKDTKELVVLLFSDVLLMTKMQKKSDKLKVVRPPLPLERIHCIELKDGYSFMLVEVGDLGCAVSVNFLSTPSPDSCASWVSALRETQAALETLRINETNKTLKTNLGGSERPTIQDEMAGKVLQDPDGQSRSDSDTDPAELVERSVFPVSPSDSDAEPAESARSMIDQRRKSDTQSLMDVEQSKVQQIAEDRNSPLIGQRNDQSQSAHEEVAGKTDSAGFKTEVPFKKVSERRVTWKQGRRASSTSNEEKVRNPPSGPGGHVETYYATQSMPSTSLSNKPLITTSTYEDPDDDSLHSQSGDDEDVLTESKRFSRKLKSPRLRRRRPNNLQPHALSDASRTAVNGSKLTTNARENQRRASNPWTKPQDSHKVLKLGSLKNNHGTLWYVPEKRSPDPEMHSEPEQTPNGVRKMKLIKLKTQRSASIPEISSSQSSFPPSHQHSPSPPPSQDTQCHPSPLQSLLQRAKEREKERGLGKRQGKEKETNFSLQNSHTVSPSPSLSASDGEREAEAEESTAPRVISAHGWREGNVDGSEDEMKESSNVLEGISVDWPGWCFDEEEVFVFEDFDDEDWPEMTRNEPRRSEPKSSERQDDSEWSEV